MLAAAAVMIPTVWLPSLKALSYLGVCGITATATVATTVSSCVLEGFTLMLFAVFKLLQGLIGSQQDSVTTGLEWVRRLLILCSAGSSRPVPIAP